MIDFDKLAREVKDVVLSELGDVISGTARDLQEYAGAIAKSLVSAAQSGDAARKAELIGQLKVLADIQRVRVNKRAWAVVEKVVSTAAATLSAVLGGVPGMILGAVANTGDTV